MKKIYNADLKIFEERKDEETISFKSLIKKLEVNRKLKFVIYSHVNHGNKRKK